MQESIPMLARHFLTLFREKMKRNIYGISDQAMTVLVNYAWPGNVRELRHVIERACVLCTGPTISLEHFPEDIQNPVEMNGAADRDVVQRTRINLEPYVSERDEIIDILKRARGNKAKASRMLNIDRSTLYRKMQRLKIDSGAIANEA
jgi:DNA-binding NtrC family response regulator